MIENGQQPLHYHGFGVVVLNLETFSKVRTIRNQNQNKGYSNSTKEVKLLHISYAEDSLFILYDVQDSYI